MVSSLTSPLRPPLSNLPPVATLPPSRGPPVLGASLILRRPPGLFSARRVSIGTRNWVDNRLETTTTVSETQGFLGTNEHDR